ncbi:hypothetical protein HDU84_002622 [Entophlyctis sp. JEL0112]|nr:hypothetical protein HDU84_002622 [Entophlyctis sp. JEL0112]
MIAQSAVHPQTPVSLRQMVDFGMFVPVSLLTYHNFGSITASASSLSNATVLDSTLFLRSELPIRFAKRIVELNSLPHGLAQMPAVKSIAVQYMQSYKDLIEFPSPADAGVSVPSAGLQHQEQGKTVSTSARLAKNYCFDDEKTREYNARFTDCIAAIKKRHDSVALIMAQGIAQLKQKWQETQSNSVLSNPPTSLPENAASAAAISSNDNTDEFPDFRQLPKLAQENKNASYKEINSFMFPALLPKDPAAAQHWLPLDLRSFLDRFYMSRIGIRFLIGQHIALHKALTTPPLPNHVGIINTRTSIQSVISTAAANAHAVVAETTEGLSPADAEKYIPRVTVRIVRGMGISGNSNGTVGDADDVEFVYAPSHLHHMLFELLKNSMRATVQKHYIGASKKPSATQNDQQQSQQKVSQAQQGFGGFFFGKTKNSSKTSDNSGRNGGVPEVRVIVAEGEEDVTIKISDEGGGIPRSGLPLIWSYLYTTANMEALVGGTTKAGAGNGREEVRRRRVLSGYADQPVLYGHAFGYGIPSSRLYARYFGGNLKVVSMEGYGTDVYLHVNKLGDSEEPLM